jgi:hypothetical protein
VRQLPPEGGVGGGGSPKLVVIQSPASKDVNTEAEEATLLQAITRQLVKTHRAVNT